MGRTGGPDVPDPGDLLLQDGQPRGSPGWGCWGEEGNLGCGSCPEPSGRVGPGVASTESGGHSNGTRFGASCLLVVGTGARFARRSLHRPPGRLGNLGPVRVRLQARLTEGSVSCGHALLQGPACWARRGEGPQPPHPRLSGSVSSLLSPGIPSPGWAGEVCWGVHSCLPKKLTPAPSSRESGMIWLAGRGGAV